MATTNEKEPYDTIQNYLLEADERTVFRILPHHAAFLTSLSPRLALEALVEATFQGDAILHWEIQCPACGKRAEKPDWLRSAHHDHTCVACRTTFNVHLDDEAQVTFSPHPTLRKLGLAASDLEFQREVRERFAPTTVQELMTVQTFHDWARNEPLPAGEYLQVRQVTLWFSDLTGSTALYARNGDPFAYYLVREHFDAVFQAIHEHEGAVVKTIGDGIMATFVFSVQALEAALAAHRALDELNESHRLSDDKQLHLKIGIHSGPAIVVNLNDRLDYFGTAVNVASRVSDLARGTETLFTEAMYADAKVQALTASRVVESFQSNIRGLDEPYTVYRLAVCRGKHFFGK